MMVIVDKSVITHLSLDLDDTMWDNRQVILAAEKALYAWLAKHYPKVALQYTEDELHQLRRKARDQYPQMAHDISQLRMLSIKEALRAAGYSARDVRKAFAVFLEARHRYIQLFPDVLPALKRLSRRFKLSTLSNGNAEVQKIRGLGQFICFAVNAEMVGAQKPAAQMFNAVIQKARCAPEKILHIGDDAWKDVYGAKQVGMQSAWINRNNFTWQDKYQPDYVAKNLLELCDILGV